MDRDRQHQGMCVRVFKADFILSSGTLLCYGATMRRFSAEAGNADKSSP